MKHLRGIEISPSEAGDIDESPDALLSADELKVYVEGPPEDDRTTTIQDSFVSLAAPPKVASIDELKSHSSMVKTWLKERTFQQFPDSVIPLDPELVFRTIDYAAHGVEKYMINTEVGWKLKTTIYWRHPKQEKKPMMVILRNPEEEKNASEQFSYQLNDQWNVAIIDVRGVGESGWPADMQWHVRRASAWTGRTIASMRVYDLLRFLEFFRTLPGVDADQIGVAGRNEMSVIALYGALLDGKCQTVILQDPPETQNFTSNGNGRGEAIEMLNCLRITDVNQLPALIYPTRTIFVGEIPEAYQWAEKSMMQLGIDESIESVPELEQFTSL